MFQGRTEVSVPRLGFSGKVGENCIYWAFQMLIHR